MNACVALKLSSASTGESTAGRVVNRDSKLLVSSTPLCAMWQVYESVHVCVQVSGGEYKEVTYVRMKCVK